MGMIPGNYFFTSKAVFLSANVWPDGIDVGRRGEGPEFESGRNFFLFAYFLFFFFFFSLRFLLSYCSFVLFLYIA